MFTDEVYKYDDHHNCIVFIAWMVHLSSDNFWRILSYRYIISALELTNSLIEVWVVKIYTTKDGS